MQRIRIYEQFSVSHMKHGWFNKKIRKSRDSLIPVSHSHIQNSKCRGFLKHSSLELSIPPFWFDATSLAFFFLETDELLRFSAQNTVFIFKTIYCRFNSTCAFKPSRQRLAPTGPRLIYSDLVKYPYMYSCNWPVIEQLSNLRINFLIDKISKLRIFSNDRLWIVLSQVTCFYVMFNNFFPKSGYLTRFFFHSYWQGTPLPLLSPLSN